MYDANYWTRLRSGRLTRRRLLGAAAAGSAGLSAAALVGCGGGGGGGEKAAPTGAAAQPQKGGNVRVMLPTEPPAWDPHVNAVSQTLIWSGFVSDRLFGVNPDTLDPTPRIVTKWEYVDDTTLVLTIREGIRFHDRPPANGRAMTAADVAYTFQRASTNDPAFTYYTRYRKVDKIEAPDAKTVRIKLKEPSGAFLTFIGGETVLNREAMEAIPGGVIKDPRLALGIGPFMVTEYQPGAGGKLVRSSNYWDSGKPYLDSVSWSVIADRAAVIAAFRTGDLDFGTTSTGAVDNTEKAQLERGGPALRFPPVPMAWPATFLTMNDRPPFNDVRVRKAVDLVTDRQQLVQVIKGGSAAPTGPIWDGFMPGYGIPDKELLARPGYRQPKDQDIAEAKRLLAAAGYGQGLDVPADGTEYVAWLNLNAVPASVDQFAKAGIKLHVEKLHDRAAFLDTAAKGTALFRSFGVSAAVEPQDQLFQRFHSTAVRNYEHYKNPEVDRDIEKLDRTLDADARKKLAIDIQRKIMEEVPIIHLIWATDYAVVQPTLQGVQPTLHAGYGVPGEWWRAKS